MTREMTGAEMVMAALADQGVKHIFGYPGGAVLPIYDALFAQDKVQHILVRHEQGAVHAAEGYARSTGKVGCVLVTSGPGATNAVTGLTDALCDSIPIVCFTGQVPTHLIGKNMQDIQDVDGKYFAKDMNELAKKRASFRYGYKFVNPSPKRSKLRTTTAKPWDKRASARACTRSKDRRQQLPVKGA